MRPIRWAWRPRIPIGKPSLIVGNEGAGKGVTAAYLAAQWSRGTLPGDLFGKPTNVAIFGDEDALNDTWTPRLYLAKADFRFVHFQNTGDFDIDFTEPGDMEHLRGWVRRYQIGVVIFDAVLDHIGGSSIDEFKAKAVRLALRPLRKLAEEEQFAAVGNMHPRKGRVSSFRDLVANSHQFNAASRSSLLLAKHPDDEERRVLAWGKGNHAGCVPTLEFRVEPVTFVVNGMTFRDARAVDWAESEVTLEDAINGPVHKMGRPRDEAKWDAIAQALTDEPQSAMAIALVSGASRSMTYDALGDYTIDGIAAKSGQGWVRGPRWADEYGREESSEKSGEGLFGQDGFEPPARARARKGETEVSKKSLSGLSGHLPAPSEAPPEQGEQTRLNVDGNGHSNGSADAERRARAEAAIRRAQERGA
jgi:hypothetical protein